MLKLILTKLLQLGVTSIGFGGKLCYYTLADGRPQVTTEITKLPLEMKKMILEFETDESGEYYSTTQTVKYPMIHDEHHAAFEGFLPVVLRSLGTVQRDIIESLSPEELKSINIDPSSFWYADENIMQQSLR